MGLSSRRLTRVVLALLALLAVVAAIDAANLWRQRRWNDVIVSGPLPAQGQDVPPQVRFAQAHALATETSDVADDEGALRIYRSLEDDSPLGQAARYNSANLLMRRAIVVQAGAEPGKAIALIELAKESYRNVLRVDPGHWEARYNLERAQRLLADPEEMDEEPPDTKRNAERAATTMRGYSPGLP
jgi:mxaK protein